MLRVQRFDLASGAIFVAVLMLAYAVAAAALTGPFVFDDFPNLSNLERVGSSLDLRHLADYLQSFPGDPGRPLSALSFLIEDRAWPTDPAPYKHTNLLLHLLNGVLVFGLTRTLARTRLGERAANIAALVAMATWLLHPMQLSTMMLVVQRMTQLMTLVSLAAVWWAAAYLQNAPLNLRRCVVLLSVTAAATLIASLCKENGALLPLYVAVTYAAFARRDLPPQKPLWDRILLAGLWLPIAMIAAYLALHAINYAPDGLRNFTPMERLMTQSRVMADYMAQIAMPRLTGSGLFHDDFAVSRSLVSPLSTLPATILCIGLMAAAFVLRHRYPLFAFSVAWYFGGHLLESTTYPLELYFEHRNYLPMVGPAIAAAIGLARMAPSRLRNACMIAMVAWLGICAGITSLQAKVWGSEALMAGIWAHENPGSVRSIGLQAKVLVREGRYEEASDLFAHASTAEQGKLAMEQLLIACFRGKLDDTKVAQTAHALQTMEFNRSSLEGLQMLRRHAFTGHCGSALTPQTWASLSDAMLANPVYAKNTGAAGFIWVEKASAEVELRNIPGAINALENAFEINKDPQLAARASLLMLNNGLCGRAEQWNRRSESSRPMSFDGWMIKLARTPSSEVVASSIRQCYAARELAAKQPKGPSGGQATAR